MIVTDCDWLRRFTEEGCMEPKGIMGGGAWRWGGGAILGVAPAPSSAFSSSRRLRQAAFGFRFLSVVIETCKWLVWFRLGVVETGWWGWCTPCVDDFRVWIILKSLNLIQKLILFLILILFFNFKAINFINSLNL